jgi:GAF domain-containing protein
MPDSLTDLAGLGVGAEGVLAAVLEASAQPLWVVDRESVIRFVSPGAVAALGYDRAADLMGRRSHGTIHCAGATPVAAAECPVLRPQATGQTVARDLDWFFRRDGSRFPVSFVSVALELPEGRGAVVAFTDLGVLGARQDALRRIAALAAGGVASPDVLAAIAQEIGHVLGLPLVVMVRYDPGGTTATVIGGWSATPHPFQAGTRWPLDGSTLLVEVLRTGRPARIDDFTDLPGTIAAASRESAFHAAAAAPIVVDGEVWGAMAATAGSTALPERAEDRLAEFTELVATAITAAESRAGLARLADEQAALRRLATLAAGGAAPEKVFAAAVEEVGHVLPVDLVSMGRYEPDRAMTFLTSWGASGHFVPIGRRLPLGGNNLNTIVFETGRPARIDDYADASGPVGLAVREGGVRSAVGTPILVEGRLWGMMSAGSSGTAPLPADTEARLASFTELLSTAIANAEARAEVGRLVDEQAALRRVATLVAEGAAPAEVFETVTREVGILSGADLARMERYESGESVVGVAGWRRGDAPGLAVGTRFSLEGTSIAAMVQEASRPVRVDSFAGARGPIAREAQGLGIRSSVGCPIVVDGRLWGVIAASSKSATPFPADTESQIAEFTELVATAIANTEARNEVAASRARIVAATDEERRRVVRDLHDGAQQRLVHTVITLKMARQATENQQDYLSALVSEALEHAEQATDELRELAHGILPAVLIRGGLRAGVDALAARMPVPVEIDVRVGRLPPPVEATAYFIVAEALTNVAKYARAGHAEVTARIANGTVAVQVRDDGVGGAQPDGSGLLGLADRLAVLHGELRIESPLDGGTLIAATIPLAG